MLGTTSSPVEDADISAVRAIGNVRRGIDSHASINWIVKANFVKDNFVAGIFAGNGPPVVIHNTIISGNTLVNNARGTSSVQGVDSCYNKQRD